MGKYQGRDVAVKVLKVYSTSERDKMTRVNHRRGSLKMCIDELIITA